MAGFSSGAGLRRRWLLTLSLVAALTAIAAGMLLWQAVGLSSLTAVSERVDQVKPLMSGLRLALIGVLAVAWPRLSPLGARFGADNEATRARWMALRWRIVGWLLVIELVIGQNVLGRFLGALAHAA